MQAARNTAMATGLNLGGGNFAFEKPSSVVYEKPGAKNQPGVDYFFESKKFPAVLGGKVKDIGFESRYGNYVVIESIDPLTGKGVDVLYGHLPNNGIYVKRGQNIQAGEIIGKQGGTGNVRSADGTIASVDFLAVAPEGSKSMTPYSNFDQLRRHVTRQLENPSVRPAPPKPVGNGLEGKATYYLGSGGDDGVAGGPTANGEIYNPNKLTAAIQLSLRDKYMNKWVKVEDMDTGKTVRVWVNDVGSMKGDKKSFNRKDPRIIDLSPAAFKKLFGGLREGVGDRIRIEIDPNQTRR
jgi:rare lipoprotein A (peptidoglycan hydrolase)